MTNPRYLIDTKNNKLTCSPDIATVLMMEDKLYLEKNNKKDKSFVGYFQELEVYIDVNMLGVDWETDLLIAEYIRNLVKEIEKEVELDYEQSIS